MSPVHPAITRSARHASANIVPVLFIVSPPRPSAPSLPGPVEPNTRLAPPRSARGQTRRPWPFVEAKLQELGPSLFSAVNKREEFEIIGRDHAFLDKMFEIDQLAPIGFAHQYHRDAMHLVGLHQREKLE